MVVANFNANHEAVVARGSVAAFTLGLQLTSPFRNEATPRAGVALPVRLTITPPGIVTVDPVAFNLGPTPASRTFTVRGAAAGTALIRIVADGYPESAPSGLTVRVTP